MGKTTVTVTMTGLDKDDQVIAGLCLPMSLTTSTTSDDRLFGGKSVGSLEELAASADPAVNTFFDRVNGIVFRRFWETRTRGENQLSECISDALIEKGCPQFRVKIPEGIHDMDCYTRMGFNKNK